MHRNDGLRVEVGRCYSRKVILGWHGLGRISDASRGKTEERRTPKPILLHHACASERPPFTKYEFHPFLLKSRKILLSFLCLFLLKSPTFQLSLICFILSIRCTPSHGSEQELFSGYRAYKRSLM